MSWVEKAMETKVSDHCGDWPWLKSSMAGEKDELQYTMGEVDSEMSARLQDR